MDNATILLGNYIVSRKISIYGLAETLHIPYRQLYKSLSVKRSRTLRASEFLAVCAFLKLDPFEFVEPEILELSDLHAIPYEN